MMFIKGGRSRLLRSLSVDVRVAGSRWGEDVIFKVYGVALEWAQRTEDMMEYGVGFEDAFELAFRATKTQEEREWLETILVNTWVHGEELRKLRLPSNPVLRKPSFLVRMRLALSRGKGMVFAK